MSTGVHSSLPVPRMVTVQSLTDPGALPVVFDVMAGDAGLGRTITHPRIQKSGLALVGHPHGIVPSRIQILGETEISFIESLPEARQREAAAHLFALDLALVIVTRGVAPPRVLVDEANATDTPLVVAKERSSRCITALHTLLDERLAPRKRLHGVLIDVFGEAGRGARIAVGLAELPFGVPVEVEFLFEIS